MNIKKTTEKLAIHELQLCEYDDATLTEEDHECLDILDDTNGVGDIELVVNRICDNHRADKCIRELKAVEIDYDSEVRKELIGCLERRYFNADFLSTVANCGDKRFKQIMRDNFFIL